MAADGIRFVKDGSSMPVELLHRLEEGGLTIFAGAGISRRFNLPDFGGLVQDVCDRLGRRMQADEEDLFQRDAFDAVLGLIERRIPPGALRDAVRAALAVPPDADLTSHSALIRLATSKQNRVRLVTTNFDTEFEQAAGVNVPAIDYAPYVPVPGREWNSVVHLHGGLGDPNDQRGRRLVLTSADFGRAYIT
jgi:NAD-dependent SIR2 family protein deacetylase